jgi:hypothetical protein
MPEPFLTRLPVGSGESIPLSTTSPATLGTGVAIVQWFDDAWWVRPGIGEAQVNGKDINAPVRLRDRDQIGIGANQYFEFVSGEKRTRRMTSAADMIARPRKRASGSLPGPKANRSFAAIASILLAAILVAGAAYVVWYGAVRAPKSVAVLDDRRAAELDSLLATAYDNIERGSTLLELGLADGAADEFAHAITTLQVSNLRDDSLAKPRIEALEATVASIYRERSLAVPENYAKATSQLTAEQMKTASLTVDEFSAKFGLMSATFEGRFGHQIVVTGMDHAEHVILYGKGGAMDLSIKGMTQEEVRWLINQSHAFHIRIKDFSQDEVLRRQVARAIKAGLLFEAGTGLHLHIDRFANKRDRWTTLRVPSDHEELDASHAGD